MALAGHDRQCRMVKLDMKEALVLFADAPIPGQVLIGLDGPLDSEETARLYTCFLRDVFETMQSVQDEREYLSLVLCYRPADNIEAFEAADLDGCLMLPQRGESLGDRIANCFEDLHESGFDSVVITRPGFPTLPVELLEMALDALAHDEEIVIGPTQAGGHYLLGLRRAASTFLRSIRQGSPEEVDLLSKSEQSLQLPVWQEIPLNEGIDGIERVIDSTDEPPFHTSRFLRKFRKKRK